MKKRKYYLGYVNYYDLLLNNSINIINGIKLNLSFEKY